MKATFFKDNIEWQISTIKQAWTQGESVEGEVKIKNHSTSVISLTRPGIGLTYADIKKVKAREVLKPTILDIITKTELAAGEEFAQAFSLKLESNCPVSDKKASFYLSFGQNANESHLQLNILPLELYSKIISLFDTFFRFKVKEVKGIKSGVEYKLLPPTARDLASLEHLLLEFSMKEENLLMTYKFSVKKLDMSGISTKMTKETVKEVAELSPREFSLGRDMINQDGLLKSIEAVLSKIKANVF